MAARSSIAAGPVKPALLAALRAPLREGERIAWAASPVAEPFEPEPRGTGKWEVVAILGGGYATLTACVMAFRTGQWLWLSTPCVLFACGLAWFFGARWKKARARRASEGTVYGLTTQRALIVRTYPAPALQALDIDAIADVSIVDQRGDLADLDVHTSAASEGLVFHAVLEPERTRAQLLRVIRDPQGAEQQIAASEAYALQMRQLMLRSGRG